MQSERDRADRLHAVPAEYYAPDVEDVEDEAFQTRAGSGAADDPFTFSDDEQPIEYDAKGTSSGRAGGRIIVTGGGGNLGACML